MKNLILLFSLIAICSSCNKNNVSFEEEIIGEWEINSFVINSCPDASDNVPLVTSNGEGCLDIMGDTACIMIVLKENGIAEMRNEFQNGESSETTALTYVIDEENRSITMCDEIGDECNTFRMDEDELYNDMDEDGCICTFGFRKTDR